MLQLSIGQGVCNFPSSVSLQQKFEATDGPDLQLSFIWQAKENASLKCEGGPTKKTRREANIKPLASLLFWVFWVGLRSHLKDVFSFACQIKLSCNTDPSATSIFCCRETEPRKLHTPPDKLFHNLLVYFLVMKYIFEIGHLLYCSGSF